MRSQCQGRTPRARSLQRSMFFRPLLSRAIAQKLLSLARVLPPNVRLSVSAPGGLSVTEKYILIHFNTFIRQNQGNMQKNSVFCGTFYRKIPQNTAFCKSKVPLFSRSSKIAQNSALFAMIARSERFFFRSQKHLAFYTKTRYNIQ